MSERISEAEHAVMEVLWREAPLGAVEVAAKVDRGRSWSARTVKTLLSRLLAKGVIAHEEEGRRYLYRPAVSRDAFVARESERLLDRMFGQPFEKLMRGIPVPERVFQALVDDTGPFAPYLAMVRAAEGESVTDFRDAAENLLMSVAEINRALLRALTGAAALE